MLFSSLMFFWVLFVMFHSTFCILWAVLRMVDNDIKNDIKRKPVISNIQRY